MPKIFLKILSKSFAELIFDVTFAKRKQKRFGSSVG